MDKHKLLSVVRGGGYSLAVALCGCGGSGNAGVDLAAQPLVAACATSAAPAPAGAWTCPNPQTVECTATTTRVDTLYVNDSMQSSCAAQPLNVSDPGPFAVGQHTITVSDGQGKSLCSAQLDIVDTQAPTLTEHTLNLWPPNHKLHGISVSECVSATDACDGVLEGEFIWASSDEPVDSIGDGHFGPDIGFTDLRHACVRSERQGPKDGRVYKLGVRVVDAAGNAAEGSCTVIVDHDQRGTVGKDSGEAYRVTVSAGQTGAACDGAAGAGGSGSAGAAGGGNAGTSGGAGGAGAGAGAGGSGSAGTSAVPVVDAGSPQ